MKKLSYLLILPLFIVSIACGGGGENQDTDSAADSTETATAGMTEIDLSPYGMNLSIMVPGEETGKPMVVETEMGGVDIMVGGEFAITVLYGMGDIALVKSDLEDDLVYEATILKEEPDMIIYEKTIPDSGIEPEYHFYRTVQIDGQTYDIQNVKDHTFGKASIEKMAEAAKTLRSKDAS